VLDLGAGWGEFTRNIKAAKKYSMDLNPECGKRVAGISQFLQQDCSTAWPLENESLDIVFTSNFLEHLPDKNLIDKTLKEAYRALKKGGLIICIGPNIQYLPGLYWDYWDHYTPITGASMAEALKLQQFSIKRKTDKFLPYTMSGGKNPPLAFVSAYLQMPFFWKFIGKQFFVIGQK
jgi:ubiquinone/menaquinone biosynthesis C-methylase UbiE